MHRSLSSGRMREPKVAAPSPAPSDASINRSKTSAMQDFMPLITLSDYRYNKKWHVALRKETPRSSGQPDAAPLVSGGQSERRPVAGHVPTDRAAIFPPFSALETSCRLAIFLLILIRPNPQRLVAGGP